MWFRRLAFSLASLLVLCDCAFAQSLEQFVGKDHTYEYFDLPDASYHETGTKFGNWTRIATEKTFLSPADRRLAAQVGFQGQVYDNPILGKAVAITGSNDVKDWITRVGPVLPVSGNLQYTAGLPSLSHDYLAGVFARAVSSRYPNIPCIGDSAGGALCIAGFGALGNKVITENTAAVWQRHIPANSSNITNVRYSNDFAGQYYGTIPGTEIKLTPLGSWPISLYEQHTNRRLFRDEIRQAAARFELQGPSSLDSSTLSARSSGVTGGVAAGQAVALGSAVRQPEWMSISPAKATPNSQIRGMPQEVLTPNKGAPAASVAPPASKLPTPTQVTPAADIGGVNIASSGCGGASSSLGGIHCGSSRPAVSATALDGGGVRVAPTLPPSSKGSQTETAEKGATSYNLPKPTSTGVGGSPNIANERSSSPMRGAPSDGGSQTGTAKAGSPTPPSTTSIPGAGNSTSAPKAPPSHVFVPSVQSRQVSSSPVAAPAKPTGGDSYKVAVATPASNPAPSVPASSGPGGISLNKAAAEKLSLNLDFDGAFFADGRIVLSGRPQAAGIDAALFLTSLRLACEPGDPSFSLDPDNGQAWVSEGRELANIVWGKVESRFGPRTSRRQQSGLSVSALSARTELGPEWGKLLSTHPNFKTRLVFKPEWLSQTRFGEILFKADVLLKELTGGVPTLKAESSLRAAKIEKYVPSNARGASRALLESYEQGGKSEEQNGWRGHRLWFDLVAQSSGEAGAQSPAQVDGDVPAPRTSEGAAIFRAMKDRNYISVERVNLTKTSVVTESGGAVDLSQVYPQMFVRRHDSARGMDLPGRDPDMDLLSADVNQRTPQYAAAYEELRDLTDIFRAYIVASKYVKLYPSACVKIQSMALLAPEKTEKVLPEYHPSELFITVASFQSGRLWRAINSRAVNGGISLRGKLFSQQQTTVSQPTPVTLEVSREVETERQESSWKAPSGRQFVSLRIGFDDELPTTTQQGVVPQKAVVTPPVSGTIGRFEVFEGSRITGNKLQSSALASKYSKAPKGAIEECARICSVDANCIAFEIDQSTDQCQTYSTVLRKERQPKWTHGEWR